jgi:hypothetical protein
MVRMATVPRMRIACTVPAGTHTARCGGTTQVPASVSTVITPDSAWMSCASACR